MEELFMRRCFDLARMGEGKVSPNPMVGSVLVYQNRIIGEGYHARFGGAHAEVHALASVAEADRHLISKSTLYVSLEPCCIFGKTPPCTNLILDQKIPQVVVSCLDLSPEVNGRGIQILREAGVEVHTGLLEAEGKRLVAPRHIYALQRRPYIILKWAQTASGYMATSDRSPFRISNPLSKRLVHRWRSAVDAILVGSGTARHDNPQLDNRYFFGKSPRRIVLDRSLSLPSDLHLFDGSTPTLVVHQKGLNAKREIPGTQFLGIDFHANRPLDALMEHLYQQKTGILFIEGGAEILRHFLQQGLWDEARVITSQSTYLEDGISAPEITLPAYQTYMVDDDRVNIYFAPHLKSLNLL